MADAVAFDLAAGEIDEMEARLARRLGEVGDGDRVAGIDAMLVDRRLGAGIDVMGVRRPREQVRGSALEWARPRAVAVARPLAQPRST